MVPVSHPSAPRFACTLHSHRSRTRILAEASGCCLTNAYVSTLLLVQKFCFLTKCRIRVFFAAEAGGCRLCDVTFLLSFDLVASQPY
jgi:hypothetical protein